VAFGQLWHVFNMRQPESGVLANEGTRTRYVWAAVGVCVLLLFGAVYIPGVGEVVLLGRRLVWTTGEKRSSLE
jgi:Ca2+-transporting ATPase